MNRDYVRRSGRLFVLISALGFTLSVFVFIYLFVSTEGQEPEGFCERVSDGSGQLPMGPYGLEGIDYTCRVVMQGEANFILFGYAVYFVILIYLLIGLWRLGCHMWRKLEEAPKGQEHEADR